MSADTTYRTCATLAAAVSLLLTGACDSSRPAGPDVPTMRPAHDYIEVGGTFGGEGDWGAADSGHTDSDPACINPLPRSGQLDFWWNIPNVGNTHFWAPGPFYRVTLINDSTAYYGMSGVAESDPSGWIGEGQVKMRCRKIGPGPFHVHWGKIIGVNPNQWTVKQVYDPCPDGSVPIQGECPPNDPVAEPSPGGGGGEESPCGPEVIVCECYELWAWFMWVDGVWTQVSDPWWQYVCSELTQPSDSTAAAMRERPTLSVIRPEYRKMIRPGAVWQQNLQTRRK